MSNDTARTCEDPEKKEALLSDLLWLKTRHLTCSFLGGFECILISTDF